jgi:hypothetical protein
MTRPPLKILAAMFTTAAMISTALYGGGQRATTDANLVWKWYSNVRFHYAICYPGNLLQPQGESENGDGQIFRGEDGARLSVYGRNNALNEKLSDVFAETQSRLVGRSGRVTYKLLKSTWFVVTGLNGPIIFYVKTIYSDGQFKSFQLIYNRSSAAVYFPVVRRMNSCFTDVRG